MVCGKEIREQRYTKNVLLEERACCLCSSEFVTPRVPVFYLPVPTLNTFPWRFRSIVIDTHGNMARDREEVVEAGGG